MTTEILLSKAVRDMRTALAVRDLLIRQLRSEGATFRHIAALAQLTPAGVKWICDRKDGDA
jgi:hypothetical protein